MLGRWPCSNSTGLRRPGGDLDGALYGLCVDLSSWAAGRSRLLLPTASAASESPAYQVSLPSGTLRALRVLSRSKSHPANSRDCEPTKQSVVSGGECCSPHRCSRSVGVRWGQREPHQGPVTNVSWPPRDPRAQHPATPGPRTLQGPTGLRTTPGRVAAWPLCVLPAGPHARRGVLL